MEKPPKDAVAALEELLADEQQAEFHIEQAGREVMDTNRRDALLWTKRGRIAALRWALKMAREMEGKT